MSNSVASRPMWQAVSNESRTISTVNQAFRPTFSNSHFLRIILSTDSASTTTEVLSKFLEVVYCTQGCCLLNTVLFHNMYCFCYVVYTLDHKFLFSTLRIKSSPALDGNFNSFALASFKNIILPKSILPQHLILSAREQAAVKSNLKKCRIS